MPSSFNITSQGFETNTYLGGEKLTSGAGPGVNDPSSYSAIAIGQTISAPFQVDLIPITLVSGQTYTFDIDDGAGDGAGQSFDSVINIIDARGHQVGFGDDALLDPGSVSTADSLLSFTATTTGVYFIAVRVFGNGYEDNGFEFGTGASTTGDYNLIVSTTGLPDLQSLTNSDDNVTFGSGVQRILARDGNDRVELKAGNDFAAGQGGRDLLRGGLGDDDLSGGSGSDELHGGSDNDVVRGDGGADKLYGELGDDTLWGGTKADRLFGNDGNDTLWGGAGSDIIKGGDGSDFIRGGNGLDTMSGGSGADTFHFLAGESDVDNSVRPARMDKITDFASNDLIDVSDLASAALLFRGSDPFQDGAGQLRVLERTDRNGDDYQLVRIDFDGDRETDLSISVYTRNDFNLTAGDFSL
jgi:serralysin